MQIFDNISPVPFYRFQIHVRLFSLSRFPLFARPVHTRLRALNDVLLMIKTHAVSSVYKNYFLALYIIFSILPQILQVKAQLVLMCFHLQTSMFFLPYILIKYWQVFASMWSSHSVREINHQSLTPSNTQPLNYIRVDTDSS